MYYEERDCEDFVYMYGYGIRQEIRDSQDEQQKINDAYMEWYQTVGAFDKKAKFNYEEYVKSGR